MTLAVATRYAAGRMPGPPLPRCLVVDDDASMRLLTAIRLEEVGGDVLGLRGHRLGVAGCRGHIFQYIAQALFECVEVVL